MTSNSPDHKDKNLHCLSQVNPNQPQEQDPFHSPLVRSEKDVGFTEEWRGVRTEWWGEEKGGKKVGKEKWKGRKRTGNERTMLAASLSPSYIWFTELCNVSWNVSVLGQAFSPYLPRQLWNCGADCASSLGLGITSAAWILSLDFYVLLQVCNSP